MYILHSIWWESNTFSGVTCDWHLTLMNLHMLLWNTKTHAKFLINSIILIGSCYLFIIIIFLSLVFVYKTVMFSRSAVGRLYTSHFTSFVHPRRPQHFRELIWYITSLVWRHIKMSWISPLRITIKVHQPSVLCHLNWATMKVWTQISYTNMGKYSVTLPNCHLTKTVVIQICP
jgi:hypothetical protein